MSWRASLNGVCAAVLALSGCVHKRPPPPSSPPKYFLGYPYQTQGEWRYPQDFPSYDATGLASVIQDRTGLTSDNEIYDPAALIAASPVLQLPAIVTVTNLFTGLAMDVRVTDRGPDDPGRVLAVTPRVAKALGFPADGVAEVRVVLNAQATAALDASLGQGPQIAAAPEAAIQSQSLAAPGAAAPGIMQTLGSGGGDGATAPAQLRLSGQVTQSPPSSGPLYVQIPGYGHVYDARRAAAALYGIAYEIVPIFGGDRVLYALRCGPYHSVPEADAALRQLLGRGLADPEIIVR